MELLILLVFGVWSVLCVFAGVYLQQRKQAGLPVLPLLGGSDGGVESGGSDMAPRDLASKVRL